MLVACERPAEAPSGPPYALELQAGPHTSRGRPAWIADVLAAQRPATHWFNAQGSGSPLPATIHYEERETDEGVPVLRVLLAVEPEPLLGAQLELAKLELDAHVELERRDQTIDVRRDLPIAVERALALLDAKVTVARGTDVQLRALLSDADPEVVLIALDGVAHRRLEGMADAVHTLLEHDDERVAMQAVECLGLVGRPEHVPGLVRQARLADRAHAYRLYEALANVGGQHARGFLEFAARNEDDPELVDYVEQALAHVSAREPQEGSQRVARGHRQ